MWCPSRAGFGDAPPLPPRRAAASPNTTHKQTAATLLKVHYVGYLADSGEVFIDTRSETQGGEPALIVAGRGALCARVRLD